MTGIRRVRATDGVPLAVYESGDRRGPTLIAVHGYPDNHHVWDGLAAALAGDFHVVTYDVRGSGASGKPRGRHPYRIAQLVDDLVAVVSAVSADEPLHLVGHDWGSIQLWPAVRDARLAPRVAGFTSISGPCLDYAGAWLRKAYKHPRAAARQLAHSYYIAAFQLPRLPEAAARRGLLDRAVQRAGPGADGGWRTSADKVNGIWLYRANMVPHLRRPRPVPATIPVQVVVPEADAFVTAALASEAPSPWVPDLTVHRVAGGHWVVSEQPAAIARLVRDFAARAARAASGPDGR
jgi:pimeloyl-ACP methyl ester carboxylesterase